MFAIHMSSYSTLEYTYTRFSSGRADGRGLGGGCDNINWFPSYIKVKTNSEAINCQSIEVLYGQYAVCICVCVCVCAINGLGVVGGYLSTIVDLTKQVKFNFALPPQGGLCGHIMAAKPKEGRCVRGDTVYIVHVQILFTVR